MNAPRLPAASKAQSVVRGNGKVQQPRNFALDTMRQPDVKMSCPLCIEELDDTDRDFYPCPCGYQICLFCYEQVKEKCKSQCPGCRREYGEPVGAPLLKQGSADDRPSAGRLSAVRASNGSPGGHQTLGANNRAAAAAAAAAALAMPVSSKQQLRGGNAQEGGSGARGARGGDDTAPAALPSGATWAAAAIGLPTRQPPASIPADRNHHPTPSMQPPPVDTSSWPSLMDSTASSMRRPARQEPSQIALFTQSLSEAADSDASRCRSSSPSSTDLTPLDSHSSSSQDLSHDQSRNSQDTHGASAALAAQGGRAGNGGQGPAGGAKAASASRPPAAASKAPPPGFGAAAPAPVAVTTSCPTHKDPSVAGPPLGRFQPIQPPPHHSSTSMQQPHLQVTRSYYSLWSGLPGIELNLGQSFGPVHVVGAYPCNPPLGPFQVCYSAKPPPPGFGPSAYASPHDFGAHNNLRMYQAGSNAQFSTVRPSMAV